MKRNDHNGQQFEPKRAAARFKVLAIILTLILTGCGGHNLAPGTTWQDADGTGDVPPAGRCQ